MQKFVEKLINSTRISMGTDYNKIDFYRCKYDLNTPKMLVVTPVMVSINFVDVDCAANDICTDPLRVFFNKPLPTSAESVEYDEDSNELVIDGESYLVKDANEIGIFVTDLGCEEKQAVKSLMWNFGMWLKEQG